MPDIVSALIATYRHQILLCACLGQGRLPLDGSDWCRLVNMRLRREERECKCLKEEHDFWIMVHSMQSPLARMRDGNKRASVHWFLRGQDQYAVKMSCTYQSPLFGNEAALPNSDTVAGSARLSWEATIAHWLPQIECTAIEPNQEALAAGLWERRSKSALSAEYRRLRVSRQEPVIELPKNADDSCKSSAEEVTA
ncbi:MAG TPA: hypothetical protein V6D08_13345 [Candidatus Obscuribacterales bacterium]